MALVATDSNPSFLSSANVDKVVQSVTNATKRLSQISTNTQNSSNKRKSQNRIGPWKLGRTLGRGLTGRVRLAKNIYTGKLAAVKIVPKANFKKLENPKYRRAGRDRLPYGIEREIIIMKLISHPNIMGLYDVWENKNDLYLILEYIEGGELFDYLIKRGRLQEFEAINYFKQIIHGISYLHQFNICHRDLKPENLLLDTNKNIKIADFGMAALEVREKLLETSCGSPHYASPEIVAGKNYHGAPSDIWSCGIILFALLTGHLPFDDENIRKLLLKVQSGKFLMPAELSWEAKDLIMKMLKVNPNDRISIDLILQHPLLTKYPEPSSVGSFEKDVDFKNLNIKPMASVDKIDKEILKNLSVLFHNASEGAIVTKLLSPSKCSEKMFYYLLMKYRNEHNAMSSSTNYFEDDVVLTGSESKQTLPRSTSIVKTVITNDVTGEKTTTIQKVPSSTSYQSTRSLKKKHDVLANISNTIGGTPPHTANGIKTFTASTSFNKKKTYLNNTVISRSSSNKSLKKGSPPPNLSPPKLLRKLTGLLTLNDFDDAIPEPPKQKAKISSRPSNKSLANFEMICQQVFGDEPKSVDNYKISRNTNMSTSTINKLTEMNEMLKAQEKRVSQRKPSINSAAKREAELADRVHRQNDATEKRLNSQQLHELKIKEERRRQSILLQEKQKEALAKLQKHKSSDDFKSALAPHRNITTPNPSTGSSLDPRAAGVNSLLRAKSLASPSSYASLRTRGLNNKNTKVLHKLGIEVMPQTPAGSLLNNNMKTSSSRNLAGYLNEKIETLDEADDEQSPEIDSPSYAGEEYDSFDDKENVSLMRFNEREKEMKSKGVLKPTSASNTNSMAYKSLLSDINESKEKLPMLTERDSTMATMATKFSANTRYSQHDTTLIPNPRFSRFSFNGLLASRFNDADITIMQNTLTTHGTVVRKETKSTAKTSEAASGAKKSASKNMLKTTSGVGMIKKSTTSNLLGLGIDVRHPKEESSTKESRGSRYDNSNFISVDLTDTRDDESNHNMTLQKNAITLEEDDFTGSNSDSTILGHYEMSEDMVDMSHATSYNFDILSSRSAEIGTMNKSKPTLVSHLDGSNETLTVEKERVENKQSITSMYKNYETLYAEPKRESTSKNVLAQNKPDLSHKPVYERDFDDSEVSERKLSFHRHDSSNIHILDTSSILGTTREHNDEEMVLNHEELAQAESDFEAEDQVLGTIKKSRASTQIFSTMALPRPLEIPRGSVSAENEAQKPAEAIRIVGDKEDKPLKAEGPGSVFRRFSLKPKREAPRPPATIIDNVSKRPQEESSPKTNWFKKFFSNFTSSGNKTRKAEKRQSFAKAPEEKVSNKNVHVIDSSLSSVELTRVIRNQLELKKIEGSVSEVDFDEEFGLIHGVIRAKYASGRKLKFAIEIIDLVNSSSLHLVKERGSDKGFGNLINIVHFIIKQEEEATSTRKSTAYKFSGYKA